MGVVNLFLTPCELEKQFATPIIPLRSILACYGIVIEVTSYSFAPQFNLCRYQCPWRVKLVSKPNEQTVNLDRFAKPAG